MHKPVMLNELAELMGIRAGGTYVDGTLGAGGHAEAILERAGPGSRLLGIDRDADAVARAAGRLSKWASRCVLEQGDFADMVAMAERWSLEHVDGVVLDLGLSSDQLDAPDRGFSFQQEGPLDMRMDRRQPLTAADLVNREDERTLADLLFTLGEEHAARRIARLIVEERRRAPISTTTQLANLVTRAKGQRGRLHPATKTFQALRMAVNRELESLAAGLEGALRLVSVGGRVGVITFHSLEDRAVKQAFAKHVGRWESLQAGGRAWRGEAPPVRRVTRKPVTPSREEIRANPRARSAKLRVVERTG